jgi:hypothetical protein
MLIQYEAPDILIFTSNSPGMFRHDHRRIPQRVFLELREGFETKFMLPLWMFKIYLSPAAHQLIYICG